MPASAVVASLRQTAAERGPFVLKGFAFAPTETTAVALVDTKTGDKGSVRIQLDHATPARILRFEVTEAPAPIKPTGHYSGRFDIGGRKLFLHCTGSGRPTVVFQGGLSSDWAPVQNGVAPFTRACSYDPANAPWGQSDPATTPRTAKDVVADLHALLTAAHVPGPYVLTGHSDGGLFVQLYASTHPEQVKGLALVDAVHSQYHARRIALYKRLLPAAQFVPTIRQMRAPLPSVIDPEQIDIETSEAQTRAALTRAPLHQMPLFVLSHGRPEQPHARLVVADERLWRTLQAELAALVPRSKHLTAQRSGHDIQHQQPKLVVAAIRDIVYAVRDPASWTP